MIRFHIKRKFIFSASDLNYLKKYSWNFLRSIYNFQSYEWNAQFIELSVEISEENVRCLFLLEKILMQLMKILNIAFLLLPLSNYNFIEYVPPTNFFVIVIFLIMKRNQMKVHFQPLDNSLFFCVKVNFSIKLIWSLKNAVTSGRLHLIYVF